jgi:hypothetical protein
VRVEAPSGTRLVLPDSPDSRPDRGRRRRAWAGVGAALLALGVGIALALGARDGPEPAPTAGAGTGLPDAQTPVEPLAASDVEALADLMDASITRRDGAARHPRRGVGGGR